MLWFYRQAWPPASLVKPRASGEIASAARGTPPAVRDQPVSLDSGALTAWLDAARGVIAAWRAFPVRFGTMRQMTLLLLVNLPVAPAATGRG